MSIDFYIKLTLAVYRVTELFPAQEPLKQQIRESANKILADLIINRPITGGVGRIGYPPVVEKQGAESDRQKPKVSGERSDLADLLLGKTDENSSRRFMELKEFFVLAKAKKIVDSRNFLVLQREYDKIGKLFNQAAVPYPKFFKDRHKKIINIMKEKDQIQVGELRQIFPDISRRTLIRDLEELFQSGIVVRAGSGRGVHYSHKL